MPDDIIKRPNMRWARPEERMPKTHNLKAKPGYKIFIANRGEVMMSVPEPWFITIGDDSIRMTDKEPPDDDCILQLSVHYLPPGIDWSGLPLAALVEGLPDDDNDERRTLSRGKVIEIKKPGLDLAWSEQRILDVKENREAISRLCLARAFYIQALVTFDFWPEDQATHEPVWEEVLRTLHVGMPSAPMPKQSPKKLSDYLH